MLLLWLLLGILSAPSLASSSPRKESQCVEKWRVEGVDPLDIWVFLSSCDVPSKTLSTMALKRRALHGSIVDYQVDSRHIEQIVSYGATLRVTSNWLCAVSARIHTEAQLASISELPFVTKLSCVAKAPASTDSPHKETTEEAVDMESFVEREKRGDSPDSYYGLLEKSIKSMDIHHVHKKGILGKGVMVMVIDAGFNTKHEAFENTEIISQYDFVEDDTDVGGTATQTKHGTATLSIIVGNKEGDYVGVAPEAKVILAKTEALDYEELIEEDFFVRALEWGEAKGVKLVSSSLGYHTFWEFKDYNGKTSVASLAVENAYRRGVVVVMSVGNYGSKNLATPADSKGALAVGSGSIERHSRSGFSSMGPTADGRIKPDVVGPGESIAIADSNNLNGYTRNSGTSFSSPFVAGIAALLMQAHPDWTSAQVIEAIRRSSSNAHEPNIELGWGFVNALRALEHNVSGLSGRCDEYCDNGDCSNQGTCVCEELYYGFDCNFTKLVCEGWCEHKCYENGCYCNTLATKKAKCLNETIPGWTCANEKYKDGKVCDFCGTLHDPDCGEFSAKDCTPGPIAIVNLTRHCVKTPPEFVTHQATKEEWDVEDDALDKAFVFSAIVVLVVLFCVCLVFYLRRRRMATTKQYI